MVAGKGFRLVCVDCLAVMLSDDGKLTELTHMVSLARSLRGTTKQQVEPKQKVKGCQGSDRNYSGWEQGGRC